MALPNSGTTAADMQFDWNTARTLLAGLPEGRINLAHEAVDRHVAAGAGDSRALICLGRRYERKVLTYKTLADLSSRAAGALKGLGVQPGDTVAVLLGRTDDLYLAALGTWKAGAVFCPLFGAFGPGPLKSRLEVARAKVLIATEALYQRKVAQVRANLPDLEHVLLVGEDGERPGNHAGCGDFRALVEAAEPAETVATSPDAPAFVHFTSGTTGTPKGAVHSHLSVLSYLVTGQQVFELSGDDVYWCTADPGWITSTAYALIAPLVSGCCSVVDEADFDPRRWYGVLKDEKVTVWYTTPTHIRLMMRFGAALARTYRENSLRLAASVGEPLNAEAVMWGEKALGTPFLDTWWQTETGAIAAANVPGHMRPGSMGRPLPGVEVDVVQRAGVSKLDMVTDPDTVGELAVRAGTPSMFTGYVGDPDRYRASFVDGWYLTGDLVRKDRDGFLWFVGRSDDMIKSAGHTVGPFEIERALMDHPAVAEIGVVGKNDLLLREVPVAFVSLNPGFEPGDSLRLELLYYARQELGSAMAPRDVVFLESMPKTTTGKILRRALKTKAMEGPDADGLLTSAAAIGRFDDE